MATLEERVRYLYETYGQHKPMNKRYPQDTRKPYFFLHRTFLREQDLLVILNTKRCRYDCYFCSLPSLSSPMWVSEHDILDQFEYVLNELKHSLSVLDRITISNNGSVLDQETMSPRSLVRISRCIKGIRRVRTLILETRLEFVDCEIIRKIREANPRITLDILTGFETLDVRIRDEILGKRETLSVFEDGLERVARSRADLTAFVLFKPNPRMSDSDAYLEASASIEYLVEQCKKRDIRLTIRLNPMYAAMGSRWADIALETPEYKPPRLSDVLKLALEKRGMGIQIYLGLSTENLDLEGGSFRSRKDYSHELLKKAILFNTCRIPEVTGVC